METPLVALFQLIDAFKAIGIEYVVVGSLASSFHGDYRASADINLVAEVKAEHVQSFVNKLQGDFYVDDLAINKAIARGRSFNVIHLAGILKVDIFIPSSDLSKQQLERRQLQLIDADGPKRDLDRDRRRHDPGQASLVSSRWRGI